MGAASQSLGILGGKELDRRIQCPFWCICRIAIPGASIHVAGIRFTGKNNIRDVFILVPPAAPALIFSFWGSVYPFPG